MVKHLLDAIPHGVIVTDQEGTVLVWNEAASALFGYSAVEIGERPIDAFIKDLPSLRAGRTNCDDSARNERSAAGWEATGLHSGGTSFKVLVSVKEAQLADQHVHVVTVQRPDPSASDIRLRQLLEAARDFAIFMLDPTGCILHWSPGAEQMHGYHEAEIVGRHFSCFYTEQDVERGLPEQGLRSARETGRFEDEGWRVRKDGRRFWARVVITPIPDGQGELSGFALVTRDVTERKLVEEERDRHALQIQDLARASLLINSALTIDRVLRVVTDEARKIVGAQQAVTSLLVEASGAKERSATSLIEASTPYIPFSSFGPGAELITPVLQHNQPRRITSEEMAQYSTSTNQAKPLTRCGWLAVPLTDRDGQNIGVIQLFHRQEGEFTANDEAIVVQLAQIASVAIRNAQLYADEQRARRLAGILNQANLLLTHSLELDTVFNTLLDLLSGVAPSASANVMLLEHGMFVVRALRGYESRGGGESFRALRFDAKRIPLLAEILRCQESRVLSDTGSFPDSTPLLRAHEARSWLGVPLIAGGQVIGLYSLAHREPDFFTEEHRALAEALAIQAAVAIQNAQLYRQVRVGRERLATVSRRLVEVQESERRYLARELHDEIGQVLTGLKFVLEMAIRQQPAEGVDALEEAQSLVNGLISQVRQLSLDLRPAMLDDLGLLPTLVWYFERYTAKTSILVRFRHSGLGRRFPTELETAAYRIIQEALTNVARHAAANEVSVRVWEHQNTLGIQVEDNGVGFDVERSFKNNLSSGMSGMYERASLLGGHLRIESAPGDGTRISAEFPTMGKTERSRGGNQHPAR